MIPQVFLLSSPLELKRYTWCKILWLCVRNQRLNVAYCFAFSVQDEGYTYVISQGGLFDVTHSLLEIWEGPMYLGGGLFMGTLNNVCGSMLN